MNYVVTLAYCLHRSAVWLLCPHFLLRGQMSIWAESLERCSKVIVVVCLGGGIMSDVTFFSICALLSNFLLNKMSLVLKPKQKTKDISKIVYV